MSWHLQLPLHQRLLSQQQQRGEDNRARQPPARQANLAGIAAGRAGVVGVVCPPDMPAWPVRVRAAHKVAPAAPAALEDQVVHKAVHLPALAPADRVAECPPVMQEPQAAVLEVVAPQVDRAVPALPVELLVVVAAVDIRAVGLADRAAECPLDTAASPAVGKAAEVPVVPNKERAPVATQAQVGPQAPAVPADKVLAKPAKPVKEVHLPAAAKAAAKVPRTHRTARAEPPDKEGKVLGLARPAVPAAILELVDKAVPAVIRAQAVRVGPAVTRELEVKVVLAATPVPVVRVGREVIPVLAAKGRGAHGVGPVGPAVRQRPAVRRHPAATQAPVAREVLAATPGEPVLRVEDLEQAIPVPLEGAGRGADAVAAVTQIAMLPQGQLKVLVQTMPLPTPMVPRGSLRHSSPPWLPRTQKP